VTPRTTALNIIAVGSAHAMKVAIGNDRTNPAIPHQNPDCRLTPAADVPSAAVMEIKHKHLNEALAAPPQEMQKTSSDAKKAMAHGTIEKMKPRIPGFMLGLTPVTALVVGARK
jgi:hypothetical protein